MSQRTRLAENKYQGDLFYVDIRNADGHLVVGYIDEGHEDDGHEFVIRDEDFLALRKAMNDLATRFTNTEIRSAFTQSLTETRADDGGTLLEVEDATTNREILFVLPVDRSRCFFVARSNTENTKYVGAVQMLLGLQHLAQWLSGTDASLNLIGLQLSRRQL